MSRKGAGKWLPSAADRKTIWLFGISFAIFIFDRITKSLVLEKLSEHQSVPVLKGIFHITSVQNTGASFGLLSGSNSILLGISALVAALIIFHRNKIIQEKSLFLPFGLILGGALGNIFDRIFFGYVIDFLDFRVWPVFNIADSAITIGAVLLAWQLWKK
ncbi:signal peptidase II [Candidatus Woesearchaeota archaeon]|nr:signal peptidase II [Candidatus Woesearchaeota archaeon]